MLNADKIRTLCLAASDQLKAAAAEHDRDEHKDGICVPTRMMMVVEIAEELGLEGRMTEVGALVIMAATLEDKLAMAAAAVILASRREASEEGRS